MKFTLSKFWIRLAIVIIAMTLIGGTMAQEEPPLVSLDVPLAELIVVSEPDEDSVITVSGEAGAVPSSAEVEVQNLFTQQSVIEQAAFDGSFSLELTATENSPLWIRADNQATIINQNSDDETFFAGGILSNGAASWIAEGQIDQTDDALNLHLNFTVFAPELSDSIDDLQMLGELYLMPIVDEVGRPIPMNEGSWALRKTRSLLPVFENHALIPIGESEAINTFRLGETLRFRLRFDQTLPADLADGIYIPVFRGLSQIGNSETFTWLDNIVFGVDGELTTTDEFIPLSTTITIGELQQSRLLWSLFQDEVSDGSQGTLSLEDGIYAGLSNKVRFNSPTLILPPNTYPIEPYLLDLPTEFIVSDGEIQATITTPNGETLSLPAADLQQILFDIDGANQARLTILEPDYAAFPFDQYGTYSIELSGFVADSSGNRYTGGGTYEILIAELLDLTPAILPGTPFEVGDSFYFGAMVQPAFPAEMMTSIQIFPLHDDYTLERSYDEQANQWGIFNTPFTELDETAEYVVDYEARYTDSDGRLWAANLRAAGMIADPETELVINGQQGVDGYNRDLRSWFNTAVYPADEPRASQRPYFPFYSGDIAWIFDALNSGIRPSITSQQPLDYSYISAVRPDASLRQYIAAENVNAAWTSEDTFLDQIGIGEQGNQAGDFALLFGGAVAGESAANYAATTIIIAEDQPAIVQPPFGVASACDPLFILRDHPIELFFHPTATQPGHILELGEEINIAGQMLPTVPVDVHLNILSPSGERYESGSTANSFGYYFDPENSVTVDEIGIWRVGVNATYAGMTSAGLVEEPYPTGGTLGEFLVYVVSPDDNPLNVSIDPSSQPLDFTLAIPTDWTDITAYHTVRTASHVLSSGELSSNRYVYDAATLDNDFTMLDAADTIAFTFAVVGRDANGQPAIQVRFFTLLGGELQSPPSE